MIDGDNGGWKTNAIYTEEQRVKIAETLPGSIAVQSSSQPPVELRSESEPSKSTTPTKELPVRSRKRDRLIPRDCVLQVTDKRVCDIEIELRKLSLTDFPNAVSVLFRVFIELSCDSYIPKLGSGSNITVDSKLNAKLQAVVLDLEGRQKLTKQQANPVKRMSNKDSFLSPSTELLHQYVHSTSTFPATSDLRSHWDSIEPFAVAIWS